MEMVPLIRVESISCGDRCTAVPLLFCIRSASGGNWDLGSSSTVVFPADLMMHHKSEIRSRQGRLLYCVGV